jgi:hypothetical protein
MVYFQHPSFGSHSVTGILGWVRRGVTNVLIRDIASFIETWIRAFFFFRNEFHLVWCIESLKNSLLNAGVSIVMGVFRFVNVSVTALFNFS